MIYQIEPLDDLFFRSPVPFDAGGETTVLHSVFPPFPSTYAGAFRSLSKDQVNSSRSLKIGFNGLTWDGAFCFPLPADLSIVEQKDGQVWSVQNKRLMKRPISSYPLSYMLGVQETQTGKMKEQIIPYINEEVMHAYLNGDSEELTCMDLKDKMVRETKLGIAIDPKSGVAKDKQMYTISRIRPDERLKMAVDVQAELTRDHGVIKLGGEGRMANFIKTDKNIELGQRSGVSRYFKLYLATPAVFRNGWIPAWMNPESFEGYFSSRKQSIKLKLVSACVGRPVAWAGFGRKNPEKEGEPEKRPREMKYAVPAGSVYYFEIIEGSYDGAVKLFHKKCISDYRENLGFDYRVFNKSRYCDRGFGYSMVGRLTKEQEDILNV